MLVMFSTILCQTDSGRGTVAGMTVFRVPKKPDSRSDLNQPVAVKFSLTILTASSTTYPYQSIMVSCFFHSLRPSGMWVGVKILGSTLFAHSPGPENPPLDVAESFWILYNLERNQHSHSPYGYGLVLYYF